jgi:hypothetical protein
MDPSSKEPEPPFILSERELVRSMRCNIMAGSFGMFWLAAAYGFPLPLFMQALRATGFQLGVMGAIRQFAMFAQLPSAYLVEGLSRRKYFWAVVAILHRSLWCLPALLPVVWPEGTASWPVLVIIAAGLSDVLGQASTAPWLSWMADLLPPERAGRFWGIRHRVLAFFLLFATFLYGWLLDAENRPAHPLLGFTFVFACAGILGSMDIVIHFGVLEPRPTPIKRGQSLWRRLATPLRHRQFRRLTLAMGAWNAAMALTGYSNGIPGFFNVIYLQEDFGASYSQASWLILASAGGAMLWTPRIGHAIDRFGARSIAAWLMALGPCFTLAWFFVSPTHVRLPLAGWIPQPVILMSSLSLVIGGFYAGVYLCQLRLIQALTPHAGRTLAIAVHWASVGAIGSFGALLGGWIKDHFPPAWTPLVLPGGAHYSYFQLLVLLQTLIAWAAALPLLLRLAKEPLRQISKPPPADPDHCDQ